MSQRCSKNRNRKRCGAWAAAREPTSALCIWIPNGQRRWAAKKMDADRHIRQTPVQRRCNRQRLPSKSEMLSAARWLRFTPVRWTRRSQAPLPTWPRAGSVPPRFQIWKGGSKRLKRFSVAQKRALFESNPPDGEKREET